jgi:hypothetical protein
VRSLPAKAEGALKWLSPFRYHGISPARGRGSTTPSTEPLWAMLPHSWRDFEEGGLAQPPCLPFCDHTQKVQERSIRAKLSRYGPSIIVKRSARVAGPAFYFWKNWVRNTRTVSRRQTHSLQRKPRAVRCRGRPNRAQGLGIASSSQHYFLAALHVRAERIGRLQTSDHSQ